MVANLSLLSNSSIDNNELSHDYALENTTEKQIEKNSIPHSIVELISNLNSIIDYLKPNAIKKHRSFSSIKALSKTKLIPKAFRKETNFSETDFDGNVNFANINILSNLKIIFFGHESSHLQLRKATEELQVNEKAWDEEIKYSYTTEFQIEINNNLNNIKGLLLKKRSYERISLYFRMVFHASWIVSVIGKLNNHKISVISGLALSSITLIFMLIHHTISVYKISGAIADLRSNFNLRLEFAPLSISTIYE